MHGLLAELARLAVLRLLTGELATELSPELATELATELVAELLPVRINGCGYITAKLRRHAADRGAQALVAQLLADEAADRPCILGDRIAEPALRRQLTALLHDLLLEHDGLLLDLLQQLLQLLLLGLQLLELDHWMLLLCLLVRLRLGAEWQ